MSNSSRAKAVEATTRAGPTADRDQPGSLDSSDSDVSLMVRVVRGDKAALAALFDRHAGSAHAIASRLCGPQDADQVVCDVFLQLWHQPETFEPDGGSLRSFLLATAHGRSVAAVRERGRAERLPAAPAIPKGATDVVSSLPRPEREAIVLAYFGGHSCREIASLLDQPETSVRSSIRAGLSRLRSARR